MTGYPWSAGDELLAADLNAAFANAASIAGGPFLPLSGGSVTGMAEARTGSFGTYHGGATLYDGSTALTVMNNPTFTAASGKAVYVDGTYGGTTTDTGQVQWNLFLGNDSVQAPNANSVTNVANYFMLPGGSKGPRIAQQISMNVTGNTLDAPGSWAFYQGLGCSVEINAAVGGTSGSHGGALTGANITAALGPNARFVRGCLGIEIDVAVQSGSTPPDSKGGLLIALQGADAVDSTTGSIGLGIGMSPDSPSSPGFMHGIAFGSSGSWWPINPTNGVLIYADPLHATGGPAHTAATGIDFSAVTFSGNFLKSTGFAVNGQGGVDFGTGNAASATDISRHITLYDGNSGINVFSGQTNFVMNTPAWIFRDMANNQYAYIASGGIVSVKGLSAWNGTPPASKPALTGAKGGNTALASVIAALVSYGLVSDSTTA